MNKKAFTLIELLVVVLIIGVLAAIALPQYTLAVEKARLTEALTNIKTIEEQIKLYDLEHPGTAARFSDIISVDLSGGEWIDTSNESTYLTKFFSYGIYIRSDRMEILVYRRNDDNYYVLQVIGQKNNPAGHFCWTGNTEFGEKICKQLIGQGWEYVEGDV